MTSRKWIISQIGAREHYAVPRALHDRGLLTHLYTDAWCPYGKLLLRQMPDPIRSLANRYHSDLPTEDVTSFTARAIKNRITSYKKDISRTSLQYYEHHRQIGACFAQSVRDDLRNRSFNLKNSVFFGYNTGCLETIEQLSKADCLTIVDQIDPGRVHKEIVREESKRWSSWSLQTPMPYKPFEDRLMAEWELASIVVVNSEWSKKALIQQGVDSSKIEIVPLAYEASVVPNFPSSRKEKLHILWLGRVSLAKGIPYLINAARRLQDKPVKFSIVGPIHITEEAIASAPSNVTFTGRVSRNETADWYRQADIFILPTLSDGFAITQLEAMAHGLPVIATPNCGRVVTHQKDGFIIPPRDADAIAETIAGLVNRHTQIEALSVQAFETSQKFTLNRVADRLAEIVSDYDSNCV